MAEKEKEETKTYMLTLPASLHKGLKVLAAKQDETVKDILIREIERLLRESGELPETSEQE